MGKAEDEQCSVEQTGRVDNAHKTLVTVTKKEEKNMGLRNREHQATMDGLIAVLPYYLVFVAERRPWNPHEVCCRDFVDTRYAKTRQ